MGNTPNNNFPYPEATGLVKDGWEDIKDLADSIDTKLGVYAPSTPGLVKINTTSFSAVSSFSLPANTFTTTYDNYRLLFQGVATTNNDLKIRMRVAGVDAVGANYNAQFILGNSTSVTGGRAANATVGNLFEILTSNCIASIDLYSPALAVATQMVQNVGARSDSSISVRMESTSHTVATAYDSMTFIPTLGTITGNVSVYGYNK
jgi:hypothetical protein